MRKLVISIIFFASFANVSAQFKANSLGEITNTNAPITFKVDNFFAGLSGSELAAGMYLYALIVNGKEVDTKRIILTK